MYVYNSTPGDASPRRSRGPSGGWLSSGGTKACCSKVALLSTVLKLEFGSKTPLPLYRCPSGCCLQASAGKRSATFAAARTHKEKNTPRRRTLWQIGFQSTKTGHSRAFPAEGLQGKGQRKRNGTLFTRWYYHSFRFAS